MSVLDDFFGTATDILGVKSVADLYVTYNNEKIRTGLAESQNTIDELRASTEMLRTQNESILARSQLENKGLLDFSGLNIGKFAPYLLAAGGLYLVYRVLK